MFRVLSISHDLGLTDRLTLALQGAASVVRIDPAIDVLGEMIQTLRPELIVVDFAADSSRMNQATAIIRALQGIAAARPVMAIGDDSSTEIVLAAVHAGARDFLAHGAASDIVRAQITALFERASQHAAGPFGQLTLITSGQPNDGEGLFAVNYAVLQAQQGGDVVLLDFHLPTSVAGPALDLGLNYTVRDGVHDMARMDRTLLSTVLCRHRPSGLHVLPLALGAAEAMDVAGGEIIALVKLLRGLFGVVVINLAGLRHGELVAELLELSQRCYLVTSQCFTSVKACRDVLAGLGAAQARVTLVVDEYDPAIVLTDTQIKAALGLSRAIRLPRARAALLNAANKGVPLVTDQPKSAYTRALGTLIGAPPRRSARTMLQGWAGGWRRRPAREQAQTAGFAPAQPQPSGRI